MDFTAIDFETANCARGSICAVGLVRVENGKTVATLNTLVDPRAHFDWRCMNVHGITPDDVRGAPTFPEVWRKMRPFLSDNVVAHNAGSTSSACARRSRNTGLPTPENSTTYARFPSAAGCGGAAATVSTSLPKPSALEGSHHDAFEDAAVCAEIFKIFETRTNVNAFKKRFFPPF